MELPIRITIVLFVAIVVGVLMVGFSQETLKKAQLNLNSQQTTTIAADRIISVDVIGDGAMKGLIKQCYSENVGIHFVETPCFAVFAETAFVATGVQGYEPGNNFTTEVSPTLNGRAMRIIFDPFGKIIIE